MEELDPLDAELFEKTLFLLKGLPELGVLLQVEKELPKLIRSVFGEHGALFEAEDLERWQKGEARLREALNEFAGAVRSTYQGRLFAQDALQGLRIIDLSREQFDAVVMNPPFGALSSGSKEHLAVSFPNSKGDLLAIFVERSMELLRDHGELGTITSRAPFFLSSMEPWRKNVILEKGSPQIFVDLGMGVMDDAMVEAAAYVIQKTANDVTSHLRCLRALMDPNKEEAIRELVLGKRQDSFFDIKLSALQKSPSCSFAYWIQEKTLSQLSLLNTIDPSLVSIRVGMQTGNDWRFLRQWWEVKPNKIVTLDEKGFPHKDYEVFSEKWATYTKTDRASPWFAPLLQVVKWTKEGYEYKNFLDHKGKSRAALRSQDLYFKPGFSYMLRSARLVPYIVPAGAIPTAGRAQGFGDGDALLSALVIVSSNLGSSWARLTGEKFEWPKFQAGMVQSIPSKELSAEFLEECRTVISGLYSERRSYFERREPYREFLIPDFFFDTEVSYEWSRNSLIGDRLDRSVARHYDLSDHEFELMQRDLQEAISFQTGESGETIDEDESEEQPKVTGNLEVSEREVAEGLVSYAVGACFGRWDVRNVLADSEESVNVDPFKPLPKNPPGMLIWQGSGDLERQHYPLRISTIGILTSEGDRSSQLAACIRECLDILSTVRSIDELDLCETLGALDLHTYLHRPSEFFSDHLDRYSAGGRKAPIYWPLSTSSGGYTLWLYYHSLTSQTLYTAVNDFIEPKLKHVGQDIAALHNKGSARSREDEKSFEAFQILELELMELRDTLLEIAPTYRPNHDDGVQITAAPLWQLFRHKPWQKVLKETWAKLEKGDYDWAHLAMAYWPDRVREKCKTDKSLAIAYDLEGLYVEPEPKLAKTRGRKKGG